MGTWHRPSEPYDASKVHEDIKYTKEDDDAIDDWIADHVETTWHSLGTCAMKPREQGGVVDKRLNVYGTQNLKCVDLSICPVSAALFSGDFGGVTHARTLRTTSARTHIRLLSLSARRAPTSSLRNLVSGCGHRTSQPVLP